MRNDRKIFDKLFKDRGGIYLYKSTLDDDILITKEIDRIRKQLDNMYEDISIYHVENCTTDVVRNLNPESKNNHPIVYVNCINSLNVNACVKRYGDVYYIGLNKGVLVFLKEYIKKFIFDPKFIDVPYIGKMNKDNLLEQMYHYAIDFLIYHEYFHVYNGHCDYMKNNNMFEIFEENEEQKYVENNDMIMLKHALEFDADSCAIQTIILRYYRWTMYMPMLMRGRLKHLRPISMYTEITQVIISIYIFLEVMNRMHPDSVHVKNDFLKYDHPINGTRICYIFHSIKDVFKSTDYTLQESKDIVNKSRNALNKFIRLFYSKGEREFYKVGYTEIGKQYISDINYLWKDFSTHELNKYSYGKLREFYPLIFS